MLVIVKTRIGGLLEIGQKSVSDSVQSSGVETKVAISDMLKEKVAPNLISVPNKLAKDASTYSNTQGPEVLPLSYSIQTLRTQTIDFSDSNRYIKQAASYETEQDSLSYNKDGRLLDATLIKCTGQKTADLPDDEVLILHVAGVHQNELVAVLPSAPKYTRERGQSTFSDFSQYNSPGRVTVGTIRQAEEEEAEGRGRRTDREYNPTEDLLSDCFTIHEFPTKICSIEFGPDATPYGHFHTGPWVCIRTISSTVFATVGVTSRKERLQGFQRLRLVALLEIKHGDSLLYSGVTMRKSTDVLHSSEQAMNKRSRFPIVDVRFHPYRCTAAVTIDSKGNVGVFDCDLVTVKESSWEKGVTWLMKQGAETGEKEEEGEESHWMIEWAEEEEMIVLANKSTIQALSLIDGTRKTIYSCIDGSIVSMTRSSLPSGLLWIATSKDVLLLDLRTETSFQALLSWEHCCSHSIQICMSKIETINDASAILLSNRCNRLLSLYSATASSSLGPATTIGESAQVNSGLPCKESYATAPVFIKLMDLHLQWHKWIRRCSPTKRRDTERDQLMIEMARDGSVWIKVVSWSTETSLFSTESNRGKEKNQSQEENPNGKLSILPEITAQRSLHSLGPVYRVLMSGMSADGLHGHGALSTLFKASRWLQEQEMPSETMLLPHDLLALGHNEDFNLHNHGSVLMQVPLLSMSMAVSPGVQRLLQQLLDSSQSDAWTIDLSQLIQGQLCVRLPTSDTLDEISEELARMYLSQNITSRTLVSATERLASKIRDSSREIGWDLLLSSQVISMRPIVVQIINAEGEEETGSKATPLQAPSYSFSFFTPRLALPIESKASLSSHQSFPTRKRIMTKSARWLLDEWKIGSDPKEYRFQHPYGDDNHANEQQATMTGSDDYYSQSESEQRSSRGQSSKSRSMSIAQLSEGQQDSASSIPPTIGSASQPNFAVKPNLQSRLFVAQSQPVFASNRNAKPKKRRVGGF